MNPSIETILAQAGSRWDDRTGAVSMPVYKAATFRHPGLGESTGYDYARSGNPNRTVLEETMALLDGGERALAFSSGMAAIDCLLRLLHPGDTIVARSQAAGHRLEASSRAKKKRALAPKGETFLPRSSIMSI